MSSKNLPQYDMGHKRRGKCVVVNIRKYENDTENERTWSVKDVENVTKTFENFGFEVDVYMDLKAKYIVNLMALMSVLDHTDADCFVCVVMAHGTEDCIIASDNMGVPIDYIMDPIKHCKSLYGKPKLFFIQACRGDSAMKSSQPKQEIKKIDNQVTDDPGLVYIPRPTFSASAQRPHSSSKQMDAESDLLKFFSSLSGHKSYGTVETGTFFITTLCEVLNEHAKKYSLGQMIPMIIDLVKKYGIQLPDPIQRLGKEMFFKKVSQYKTVFTA